VWIAVESKAKSYGNYEHPNYSMRVEIPDTDAPETIDLDKGHRLRQLRRILLGKRCSKCIRADGEVILYPGDIISRLHVKRIAEDFDNVKFDGLPWAHEVRRFKDACIREDAGDGEDIRVVFTYPESVDQTGGEFTLKRPAADWLGKALIQAARAKRGSKAMAARVAMDYIVTPDREIR
jgi:hypothetical protein